jgi:AraC-like DNA-binding protein
VAGYVGYKYPVHFARAFKKYFGYPPNKVKK